MVGLNTKKILFIISFFIINNTYSQNIKINNSLGGNYNQGNSGLFLVNYQSIIKNDSTKLNWLISPYFCYSQSLTNNEWFVKQRESYLISSFSLKSNNNISYYLFTDIENSFQKHIKLRSSLGIGVGKTFINNNNLFLSSSIALLPEYFEYQHSFNDNIKKTYQSSLRTSLRFRLETKGNIKLSSINLIQPSIYNEPKIKNNINIRSINSITTKINKDISIGLQLLISTCTISNRFNPLVKSTDLTSSFIIIYQN